MRVLVLGAGFGGLELTTRLVEEFGGDVDVTLIDKSESFVFGFSKLDVMFGRTSAEAVQHKYADIVKPGVTFVQAEITAIDAEAKRVTTSAGDFEGDYLVIALGADFDLSAMPGLVEGGYEFYTEAGAFAQRERIESFSGGNAVIGVFSTPYKCPPAPSEAALLLHESLTNRGTRDQASITLAIDFGRPIPPSPDASAALVTGFEERGIDWRAQTGLESVDNEAKTVRLSSGEDLPFDLLLVVPHHVAPKVLVDSGITENGWVPVDSATLETPTPGVFAVGDCAAVGTPRAGVFAEGHAKTAAAQIAARIRESENAATYDGKGFCYIEFGGGEIGSVDIQFLGDVRHGEFRQSPEFAAAKAEFGSSRIERWFGKSWATT